VGATTREQRGDPLADVLTAIRWLLVACGVVALAPVAASLVLRQVDVASPRLAAYVAGTPLVLAAGLAAIVLFLLGASRLGAAVAAVLTALLTLTQVPLYLGTATPAAGSSTFTVMTLNMHYGSADPEQIVAAVRSHHVDLLATQELTNPGVAALRAAGLEELLPHSELHPGGAQGNGIWSRHPVTGRAVPAELENVPVAVDLDLDGRAVFVACVHPVSPYPDDADQWSRELGVLADWLATVDGPAIVAGDFNSTRDHRQFRDVLATGFEDAATQTGAGWLPTFPANRRRLPLLITIDHVLANDGIVATDVQRLEIPATDHAGLAVRLAIPPGV
jgi:endonuclease/exonuclease/phosphatase (EEP) superfamily protein YafD